MNCTPNINNNSTNYTLFTLQNELANISSDDGYLEFAVKLLKTGHDKKIQELSAQIMQMVWNNSPAGKGTQLHHIKQEFQETIKLRATTALANLHQLKMSQGEEQRNCILNHLFKAIFYRDCSLMLYPDRIYFRVYLPDYPLHLIECERLQACAEFFFPLQKKYAEITNIKHLYHEAFNSRQKHKEKAAGLTEFLIRRKEVCKEHTARIQSKYETQVLAPTLASVFATDVDKELESAGLKIIQMVRNNITTTLECQKEIFRLLLMIKMHKALLNLNTITVTDEQRTTLTRLLFYKIFDAETSGEDLGSKIVEYERLTECYVIFKNIAKFKEYKQFRNHLIDLAESAIFKRDMYVAVDIDREIIRTTEFKQKLFSFKNSRQSGIRERSLILEITIYGKIANKEK